MESGLDVHDFEFVSDGGVSNVRTSFKGGNIKRGILEENSLRMQEIESRASEVQDGGLVRETGAFRHEAGSLKGLEALLRCLRSVIEEEDGDMRRSHDPGFE